MKKPTKHLISPLISVKINMWHQKVKHIISFKIVTIKKEGWIKGGDIATAIW